MSDFAVRISRLPIVHNFSSDLEVFTAKLVLHIEKILESEELGKSRKNIYIGPEQIVSINYALRNFKSYKKLLEIERLI